MIYKSKEELEREAFTFSQDGREGEEDRISKLTKLAAISDSKAIRTCQFSPSGGFFAVGTNSSVLKIFEVGRLFEKNRFQEVSPLYQIDGLHQKSIFCLDWARSERALLTCSNDLHVRPPPRSSNSPRSARASRTTAPPSSAGTTRACAWCGSRAPSGWCPAEMTA